MKTDISQSKYLASFWCSSHYLIIPRHSLLDNFFLNWSRFWVGLIQGSMHCVQTAYESLNTLHPCLAELVLAQANVEQSWLFMILATFSTT